MTGQRKPRVAILTNYPADHETFAGGVETATAALLEGLRLFQDQFQFDVVSPSTRIARDVHEVREGIRFHFLGGLHRRWLRPRLLLRVWNVRRELGRLQPNVVHCQANPDFALAAILWGKRPIFTIHGVAEDEVQLRTGWEFWSTLANRILLKLAFCYIDDYICNSAYVMRLLAGRKYTYAIPNAVNSRFLDGAKRAPSAAAPYVLFAGVLAPLKRPIDLLEAHARLRARWPGLRTVFCGAVEDEAYARQMHRTIAERGIQGVTFLGAVSQETLASWLAGALALVLPSAQENAPMVITEAMALGVPVVATRVGGVPEMVEDGGSGLLYTPGDVEALTGCLERLLSDEALRERMGQRGSALARARYAPERVARATVEVYRNVLRRRCSTTKLSAG